MNEEEEICGNILDYLLKNPDAGGTLEDISKWWLEAEKIDQVVEIVANALNILLGRGLIEKIPSGENAAVYRMSRLINPDTLESLVTMDRKDGG